MRFFLLNIALIAFVLEIESIILYCCSSVVKLAFYVLEQYVEQIKTAI